MKTIMKSCVAVFLLMAIFASCTEAVISERLRTFIRPKVLECATQFGLSDSELKDLNENNLDNGHSVAQEQALFCIYKGVGMINDNAKILPVSAALRFTLGENPIRAIIAVNKCGFVRGTSRENQAWLINKCFVNSGLL